MARSSVKYTGMTVKGEAEEALSESVTKALSSAVLFWHREFMPGKFESSAGGKYNLRKRTKAYQVRKARRYRHQKYLVYTGRSERSAKMFVRVKLKAAGKHRVDAQGVLVLPKYFYMRVKNGPNKMDELGRTTVNERSRLSGEIGRNIPQELKKRRGKTATVTV